MSLIFTEAARLWGECRAEFEDYRESQYLDAIEATHGVLVNRAGRALGIDGVALFMGRRDRAERYASPELLDYWRATPRLSFAEFERRWFEGRGGL